MSFLESIFGSRKSKVEPVYLSSADRIADGKYPGQEKAVESPRPDVPATRQWVDDILNAKMKNVVHVDGDVHKHLQRQISNLRHDWYYAWFYKAPNGERIGRIMWGNEGSGYQCIEGLYSFTEGRACGQGICVESISTPSREALEAYWEQSELARWDFACGNGHWRPEDGTYLPFSKGTTFRLMASLPEPGTEEKPEKVE